MVYGSLIVNRTFRSDFWWNRNLGETDIAAAMSTPDFFRSRLDAMIDLRHPLAVLATRMPWAQIEATLAPIFARRAREGQAVAGEDLFGPTLAVAGGGVSAAGRRRLPIRLIAGLLYLKHAFNESDESVCERWAENNYWQLFCGEEYFQPRLPCAPTNLVDFRQALGEAGVEELLATTIAVAMQMGAIKPADFERVIIDTTVQVRREVVYIIVSPAHKVGDETGRSVGRSLPVHALLATAAREATGTKRQVFGPRRSPRGEDVICKHHCGWGARLGSKVNTCELL
ncbi:hypothetical protein R8510_05282 [Ralstonia chuxiongensis]|nr:hypothetical protein R8510_05282 [Ralstonia chuxiongensis]